jgi:hypothetical protein
MELTLETVTGIIGILLSIIVAIIFIVFKVQKKLVKNYNIMILLTILAGALAGIGLLLGSKDEVKVFSLISIVAMIIVVGITYYDHKSAEKLLLASTESAATKSFVLSSTSEDAQ